MPHSSLKRRKFAIEASFDDSRCRDSQCKAPSDRPIQLLDFALESFQQKTPGVHPGVRGHDAAAAIVFPLLSGTAAESYCASLSIKFLMSGTPRPVTKS
jgi:hypothetical protein